MGSFQKAKRCINNYLLGGNLTCLSINGADEDEDEEICDPEFVFPHIVQPCPFLP